MDTLGILERVRVVNITCPDPQAVARFDIAAESIKPVLVDCFTIVVIGFNNVGGDQGLFSECDCSGVVVDRVFIPPFLEQVVQIDPFAVDLDRSGGEIVRALGPVSVQPGDFGAPFWS